MSDDPAFLVFWGTLTTLVRAPNEELAYQRFCIDAFGVKQFWRGPDAVDHPEPPRHGQARPMLPTRDEVTIRRPRADDRGWIEDSRDPAFLALLPELVAS